MVIFEKKMRHNSKFEHCKKVVFFSLKLFTEKTAVNVFS